MKDISMISHYTPEKLGVPSLAITQFVQGLQKNQLPMHGIIIMREQLTVAEGFFAPFKQQEQHRLYSCSKSFVSLAIGFLEQEKKIALTDTIASYFPEKLPLGGVHPYLASTTIEDLLKMSSPHEKTTYKLMQQDDWVQTFFCYRPSHHAGSIFSYDTSATYVMGALVEKLTKMTLIGYLKTKLFNKLNVMSDAYCLKDPLGISQGGSGIMCTLQDFAKIAMVCTLNGTWQGEQIIPPDYLHRATTVQITNFVSSDYTSRDTGYGYQFWIPEKGIFAFMGMGGQVAICCPEKKLVVATTADTQCIAKGTEIISQLSRELIASVVNDVLIENSQEQFALNKLLENLQFIVVDGEKSTNIEQSISGKSVKLDDNPLRWQSLSCDFDDTGGKLNFTKDTGSFFISFGFGKNIAGIFPEYNYPCLASAGWWNERTLNIACYTTGEYCAPLRVTIFYKKDNTATIHLRNAAEQFLEEYNGMASGTIN